MARRAGRPLLQLPGPTNVPDAVRRAISDPTLDHRGAAFASLVRSVLADVRPLFGTRGSIAMYPGSGSGGCEAALVNTLSPGSRVLVSQTGYFAAAWAMVARNLGLDVLELETDWRHPVDVAAVEAALAADTDHSIDAVLVVHSETSTGALSDVAAVRGALDGQQHPALLLVDAVSSLGVMPVLHDEWRADVTVTASQKGLMLPPGLTLLAVSDRARDAHERATMPRSYWDWDGPLAAGETGSFPNTPSTNLVVGLRTSLDLLLAEGLEAVFERHRRLAAATRAAVGHWELTPVCVDPAAASNALTAVLLPEGVRDTTVRAALLERFELTIAGGLGRLRDRCLRIGHLGDIDELMVVSVLAALEMELPRQSLPLRTGGVDAAMNCLTGRGRDEHDRLAAARPGTPSDVVSY